MIVVRAVRMAKKHKTKAEQQWLSRVAELGCIICGRPAEIHHIGNGAMGKRSDHFSALPLCEIHHRTGGHGVAVHAGRLTWEQAFGTEKELLEKTKKMVDRLTLIKGDEF